MVKQGTTNEPSRGNSKIKMVVVSYSHALHTCFST